MNQGSVQVRFSLIEFSAYFPYCYLESVYLSDIIFVCVCVTLHVLALPPQISSHFTVIVGCFRSFQESVRLRKKTYNDILIHDTKSNFANPCQFINKKKKKKIMEDATLLIFFTHYLHFCYLESIYFSDITFVCVCMTLYFMF